MSGGRLRRLRTYVADETFPLTYGDGVKDVYFTDFLAHHQHRGRLATVTAFLFQPLADVAHFSLVRARQNYSILFLSPNMWLDHPTILGIH